MSEPHSSRSNMLRDTESHLDIASPPWPAPNKTSEGQPIQPAVANEEQQTTKEGAGTALAQVARKDSGLSNTSTTASQGEIVAQMVSKLPKGLLPDDGIYELRFERKVKDGDKGTKRRNPSPV